jgi:hypothetical protein
LYFIFLSQNDTLRCEYSMEDLYNKALIERIKKKKY